MVAAVLSQHILAGEFKAGTENWEKTYRRPLRARNTPYTIDTLDSPRPGVTLQALWTLGSLGKNQEKSPYHFH